MKIALSLGVLLLCVSRVFAQGAAPASDAGSAAFRGFVPGSARNSGGEDRSAERGGYPPLT